jgi:hypothetical protein
MTPPTVSAAQSFPALDVACRDIRLFVMVSITLGGVLLGASVVLAAAVARTLAATAVLSYFPLATAFILSQHLISLRIMQAEYPTASPSRQQKIAIDLRKYQEMMLATGLTAPVIAILGALNWHRSPGRKRPS